MSAMTLADFLAKQNTQTQLAKLLLEVAESCKTIADTVQRGPFLGIMGQAGNTNVQGEEQKKLDIITNDILIEHMQETGLLAGMASEEMDHHYAIPADKEKGNFLLVFDPLDGSSNVDVNIAVGTIVSVLAASKKDNISDEDFLQKGSAQLAAVYCTYGASTILVLTTGQGSHEFVLEKDSNEFMLMVENIQIPADTKEFAINASNQRHWQAPVKNYIDDCLAGEQGPLNKNYNMRWVASMVAELYRVMCRGGIFMYPRDHKDPAKVGKLRLLYEANPMSFIIEQAGGVSSTGYERIMDIQPNGLHQRVGVIMGSKNEIFTALSYHENFNPDGSEK